jgi:hypothetical protein
MENERMNSVVIVSLHASLNRYTGFKTYAHIARELVAYFFQNRCEKSVRTIPERR